MFIGWTLCATSYVDCPIRCYIRGNVYLDQVHHITDGPHNNRPTIVLHVFMLLAGVRLMRWYKSTDYLKICRARIMNKFLKEIIKYYVAFLFFVVTWNYHVDIYFLHNFRKKTTNEVVNCYSQKVILKIEIFNPINAFQNSELELRALIVKSPWKNKK